VVIWRLTVRSSEVVRERTASLSRASARVATASRRGQRRAKALEFVVAGVGGAVEVVRDASAYVALDVDGLLSAFSA
jgi:hypothetical protein